ncbi:hypothetical protein MWU75_09720 [Ornithinimicrobium sp. F0845]|uniref:hypothetical protein n=1 Tax=Ornithinimicrobium sp. F0845 TaxID=2926412 RepID=UPI001FF21B1B|nr:hypothetical protein [Ornithinimicrobium sp. F0845]MCK0112414.1 hypothetical protein [Ornithinimicrobium sp. F0845]
MTEGDLIPWEVRDQHGWEYPLAMLRVEARRRAGEQLRTIDIERVTGWKRSLQHRGAVVDYDPGTHEGFRYVPRRVGVDLDLIREPSGG